MIVARLGLLAAPRICKGEEVILVMHLAQTYIQNWLLPLLLLLLLALSDVANLFLLIKAQTTVTVACGRLNFLLLLIDQFRRVSFFDRLIYDAFHSLYTLSLGYINTRRLLSLICYCWCLCLLLILLFIWFLRLTRDAIWYPWLLILLHLGLVNLLNLPPVILQ